MKATKLIMATLGVCTVAALAAQPVQAAESETTGKITFGPEDNPEGNTTVPNEKDETPEEIILTPEDGKETTSGALRIQFVPNFNFGTHKGITAKEAKKNAELIGYKKDAAGNRIPMAPFVQVSENRGAGVWTLEVKATPFVNENNTSDKALENSYINLTGSTLTMERHTSADAAKFVTGQDANAKLLTNGTSLPIMKSIKDTTATGYNVSNVFYNNYEKEMDYGVDGKGNPITETAGVEFVKPEGKAPLMGANYKSTLTWTLSDTL